MKKNYTIAIAFAFITLLNLNLKAQNWTVGVPVDMQLSYLTKYAFGCAPQPDFNMNVICNAVSGIQYIIIVDSVQDIAVVQFMNDTLMLGDTLFLSAGNNNYSVIFVNGVGKIDFNIKAIGTPTTAGENHPCAFNDLWMSNLLLCNEGLTLNMQNTCTVDAATGINMPLNAQASIQFPSSNNQFQLQLSGLNQTDLIQIFDITGKAINLKGQSSNSNQNISCQDLNSGIYFVTLTQQNTSKTYKFAIAK